MKIPTSIGWAIFACSFFLMSIGGAQPVLAQTAPNSPTPAAVQSTRSTPTTWLVLRHAERERDADRLSLAGLERAADLKQLGEILNVAVIYSTDTERTRGTVELLAQARGIKVQMYAETSTAWFDEIRSQNDGKVVLIVGHANTAGVIAGQLAETLPLPIAHDEYDSLFVVTTESANSDSQPADGVAPNGGSARTASNCVVRLKYGRSAAKLPATKSDPLAPTDR